MLLSADLYRTMENHMKGDDVGLMMVVVLSALAQSGNSPSPGKMSDPYVGNDSQTHKSVIIEGPMPAIA